MDVSASAEHYLPRNLGPYPQLSQLDDLAQAVEDVQLQAQHGPCIVKFSEKDDAVDAPLIEHATMTLAAMAGITVATTGVLPLAPRCATARHAMR